MEKNCKLQLLYNRVGFVRLNSKLRLIDEFGKSVSYGLILGYKKQKSDAAYISGLLSYYVKMGLVAAALVEPVSMLQMTLFGISNASLSTMASFLIGLEFASWGKASIDRSIIRSNLDSFDVADEINISRKQYDAFRRSLEKDVFYSLGFSNCVQNCRKVFLQLKSESMKKGNVVVPATP